MTARAAHARYALHRGDCLRWLPTLAPGAADLVVADPPYSSGGLFRGDRANASVAAKYVQTGSRRFRAAGFPGDNRDQRSWVRWCTLWLADCLAAARPGGYLLVFADWRQLPGATDAVQAAGWVWRGLIPWDKGPSARAPNTSYFRHQAEYLVWATNGPSDGYRSAGGPWPGVYAAPVLQAEKRHPTGKPVALLRRLVQCCPPGGLVLDPFAGSGTAGVAALHEGRRYLGCELDPAHHSTAFALLAAAARESPHDPPPPAAPPRKPRRRPCPARPAPGRRPRRAPDPGGPARRRGPADDPGRA